MSRKEGRARRLAVGEAEFRWSVLHRHEARGGGRYEDCRQIVVIRRSGRPGCLHVVFRAAPGRYVPGGTTMASGTVGFVGGASLNLYEPGTARALLDEALARGWRPEGTGAEEADGWALFGAVAARRAARPNR